MNKHIKKIIYILMMAVLIASVSTCVIINTGTVEKEYKKSFDVDKSERGIPVDTIK